MYEHEPSKEEVKRRLQEHYEKEKRTKWKHQDEDLARERRKVKVAKEKISILQLCGFSTYCITQVLHEINFLMLKMDHPKIKPLLSFYDRCVTGRDFPENGQFDFVQIRDIEFQILENCRQGIHSRRSRGGRVPVQLEEWEDYLRSNPMDLKVDESLEELNSWAEFTPYLSLFPDSQRFSSTDLRINHEPTQ